MRHAQLVRIVTHQMEARLAALARNKDPLETQIAKLKILAMKALAMAPSTGQLAKPAKF